MQENIVEIDDMPFLRVRLGKARVDRIRYAGRGNPTRQKYATNLINTLLGPMQHYQPGDYHCPVNDVITGAANLDGCRAVPLSVSRLYNILQCIEMINTREVMSMMAVDQRQAQRYVRAIKVAFPLLSDALLKK